ncbi:MAG: FkbM family methyltransferase [Pseudonocardia sp.]|nr:FkbM family methyltransferase [Pseudonocardia sp.]
MAARAVSRAAKLARIARHPTLWRPLRAGVAASVEHLRVPFVQPGAVVDVGASHGQFSLLARLRFPDTPIVAFEPILAARAAFSAVLGDAVDLRPHAVGAAAGTVLMNISQADDSSSLLPIGQLQSEIFPGTQRAGGQVVDVVTLAGSLPFDLPTPWLVKIDVQGFELEVLRGAVPVLGKVGEIYVECSFVELYEGQPLVDEVICFLRCHGFRLSGVFNITSASGLPVQADLLFRR